MLIPLDIALALTLICSALAFIAGLCLSPREERYPRFDYDYGEMPVLTGESERYFTHDGRQ